MKKDKKRLLFTHNDLDGVVCAIIYNKCFPTVENYFIENNHDTDDTIARVMDKESSDVSIMISDLSPTEKLARYLDRNGVELIDHHKSALYMNDYAWATVDVSRSACSNMFNIYSNMFQLEDYKPLVELADNYDMWGYENPCPTIEAIKLNALLDLMGHVAFMTKFIKLASTKLTFTENMFIDEHMKKMVRYISSTIKKVEIMTNPVNNFKFGFVAAEQYRSSLGDAILSEIPEIEYVLIANVKTDHGSLRGRGNVDLSKLATECGGGGHPKAAGIPLKGALKRLLEG